MIGKHGVAYLLGFFGKQQKAYVTFAFSVFHQIEDVLKELEEIICTNYLLD